MKVKEVIEKLSKFNQEAEVYMLRYDENPLDNTGSGIEKVFELKGDEVNTGVYIKED